MSDTENKLVSKELLKQFGDKSKRIFRSTISDQSVFNYKVTAQKEISSAVAQKLKYVVKGSTSLNVIDSVIILNYDSTAIVPFNIQAIDYGTSPLDSCGFLIETDGQISLNFTCEEKPVYLEVELVDLNGENINIARVSENSEVISGFAAEVEFQLAYQEAEVAFEVTNSSGNKIPYVKDLVFSSILESQVTLKLKTPRTIAISGAVTGAVSTDLSGNINIAVTAGQVSNDATVYTGVRIDNNTGAIEGFNVQTDGIQVGYTPETNIYRALKVDNKNRGYITLPAGSGGVDFRHLDLNITDPSEYPGEIIQHVGSLSADFVPGYFYKSVEYALRTYTFEINDHYQDDHIELEEDFNIDSFIQTFCSKHDGKWTHPSNEIIALEPPCTIELSPVIGNNQVQMVNYFYNGDSKLLQLGPSSLGDFKISWDEYMIVYDLAGGDKVAKLTINQTTHKWERINVQPQCTIEAIDNEFIDNLN